MLRVDEIISDEEIERIHGNANFGPSISKRDVVNEGVWHVACGWHMGSTMTSIMIDHELARPSRGANRLEVTITAKGRKYLFAALKHAKIKWQDRIHPHQHKGLKNYE